MKQIVCLSFFLVLASCAPDRPSDEKKTTTNVSKSELKQQPVASVNGHVITLEEFERRLNGLAPYARMRYTSPEKQSAFLETMILFEIMADEAERDGFQDNPAVIQAMKETMVRLYLNKQMKLESDKFKISNEDIKAQYDAHVETYTRPERRRAAIISMKNGEKLKSLRETVEKTDRADTSERIKVFRRLAVRYSTDARTGRLGGDMGYVSPPHLIKANKPISKALFNLKQVGDMTPPVEHQGQWHLLIFMDKKPAKVQSLADVSRDIRTKLVETKREEIKQKLISDLRKKARVEVFKDVLKQAKKPDLHGLKIEPSRFISKQPTRDLQPKKKDTKKTKP